MKLVHIAALAALAGLGACAGPGHGSQARMPFHVAIIPFTAQVSAQPDAKPDDLHLAVDAQRLENLLVDEFHRRCVARATLLTLPDDVEAFGRTSAQEKEAYWLRSANAVGADLLLECELEVYPAVEQANNEKFWLNMPLFLLGGPACYFVDDRTYRAHAELRGRLLDLNPIAAGRADLEDGLSRLAELKATFDQTTLDFLDRTHMDAGAFGLSLLVPCGLLARDNETVQQSLEEHAEHDLARDFAQALMDQSPALLLAESVANFHLDPALRVERDKDTVRVTGDVILRHREVERLDGWVLYAGEHVVRGEFAPERLEPATTNRRHPLGYFGIDAQIQADASVHEIRLEIAEAGPNPNTRSFTFALDDAPRLVAQRSK